MPTSGKLAVNADFYPRSVVKVGDGRGFVVRGMQEYDRFILTAAHCLPHLPQAPSEPSERTYPDLVSSLGVVQKVWTECMFVDPIADIALLGPPDGQSLCNEFEAYDDLLNDVRPLAVSEAPSEGYAWLLSLDGEWTNCRVSRQPGGPIWISEAKNIQGGMSGSPILAGDGTAIGLVSSGACFNADEVCHEGGPQPVLVETLPAGIMKWLGPTESRP